MSVMRRYNHSTIGLAAFLLLIFAAGCSDGPKPVTPTAVSALPLNAAAGACPNTMVTVTFSEAMNPATITGTTFTLTGPGASVVAGVVSYDTASETATYAPTASLALNTTYTATVTTGAQGMTGKALASNFVWSFTTGNTMCQAGPPAVVSLAPPEQRYRRLSQHARGRDLRRGDEPCNHQRDDIYIDRSEFGVCGRAGGL